MASSSTAPVGPPLQPGEAVPVLASPASGEAEELEGGFAFPLVDPWYTSSPLFPPRSVDFSFPAEDWDWTSSGLEPSVDQAWVPNLDEISELLIQKGDLQAVPINFDFLCACSKEWSHWVDREVLDPDFWDRLVDAGVHWSILISRSCNMFRDTEALRKLLRRWCPSTHTFFFSWGELTPTLEDVANHWMLPILGEHSFSDIKLSAEEEEVAAALRKRASTRLSGWPAHFSQVDEAAVRRAAFVLYWLCKCTFGNFPCYSINTAFIPLAIRISAGYCFPIAPLFLGHLYSQLDLLHDCEIQGDSCYILSAVFNTSVLQTFFWEHSVSYTPIARDRSAAWGRFSDLPREFLEQFPDFRANLPLVYRWASLVLPFLENSMNRFLLIRDLKADDYRSLSYLSTVNPGFLPVLSATGVYFIPYCPQRVQRQFGLDQGVPVGPQETGTCIADLAAFLKSRAFVRWGGETTRVFIPGGHRLGFNTPSMGAYWQRFSQSMVDLVITGRSATTPMSVHRKASVSNPYLAPPSQSAISYANSQKLGFAEWDASRGGWIAYTIHLPEGWRNSVTIVEDRLIMVSKRGQVNKRDAPVDPVFEKTPKKATPSVPSSKKVSSKKAKTVKKSKLPLRIPSAAKESTAAHAQEPAKSATAPPKRKTRAGKESKSLPLVPSAAEGSTAVPLEEPPESTESPPEKARVGKKSKSTVPETSAVKESATASVKGPTESTAAPSKPKSASAGSSQQSSKRIAASRPPKSQKKVDVSSSSPDEEEPSAVPGPSPPRKEEVYCSFISSRCRWPLRQMTHESGRSSGGVVDIEDSDVADDDVIASPVRKDAPQAAAVDQDEDLGKSTAGSSEAGDESMGEEHSSSSASFFDSTPGSLPEDQIVSAGSTADDDTMSEADDSSMGGAGPMEEELAIVPHGDHDDDSAVDTDADPISFSLPQTVLTRAGFDISMAHVMEGVSLFGVTPSLRAIPAGGFVIPASRLSSEGSPVAGGALVPERTLRAKPYRKWTWVSSYEMFCFHGLGCHPMENSVPWTWLSSYGKVCSMDLVVVLWKILFRGLGCRPMEKSFLLVTIDLVVVLWMHVCVDDTVHVLEDVGEIGTAGEVTAISPPPRPTNEAGPSVDVGSLSGEVAAFLREFDARAPNPHPEQFFWSFNGPLVPFGDFWVPNDCSPYLSRLSAGHSDFTKGFKLSIGLGGPMMSLLGSVLAAMDESSLEDVTKTQILAWRSVIQDLMDVGFDLGFMMKRLRQMAQHLFGKRLADEIKALQHQIALLQDSLAELTAYQAAMTSTEGVVPRPERGGSLLDSLLD
uniref:Aminotransferase-like plant mobile domain-containing protein n=1 Tax=Fagus sylvatica TaxID=28930 RepID=A0A2N9I4R8_FAGSY